MLNVEDYSEVRQIKKRILGKHGCHVFQSKEEKHDPACYRLVTGYIGCKIETNERRMQKPLHMKECGSHCYMVWEI